MDAITSEIKNLMADLAQNEAERDRREKDRLADVRLAVDEATHSIKLGTKFYGAEQREYHTEFKHWLRTGDKSKLDQCVGDLSKKDVTIGTNVAGGYGVPKILADAVTSYARPACPFLNPDILGAQSVSTSDAHFPFTIADNPTVSRYAETSSRSTNNGTATFGDSVPVWGSYEARVQISSHAREDVAGIDQWLMEEFAASIGAQLMTDIVSGSASSGQISGLTKQTPVTTSDSASPMRPNSTLQYSPLTGATSPIKLATADIETLIGLFNESYLLDPSFRFIMRPTTLMKLLGATVEAPYLMTTFAPSLFGLRVALSSNAPAATSGNFPVLAGAWKKTYALVTRSVPNLIVDEMTVPGQVIYRYRVRYGGIVRLGVAAKLLKFSAT